MKFKPIHSCIRVVNLEKSVDFYKNAFGFIETRRKDYPEDKFTLVYMAPEEGQFEIELTYNYDQEEDYELGTGYGHIAISHPDIKSLREEFLEKGFEVTELRGLSDNSDKYFFVTDPDGYKIEIIQK